MSRGETRSSRGAAAQSVVLSALIISIASCLWTGVSALAQDLSPGKRVWSQTGGCIRCHGWSGNGTPEGPDYPAGANLRVTALTRAAVKEVVMCGRPASDMPYFDRNAYKSLTCYGMTTAQVGERRPRAAENSLNDAQLEALLDYVFTKIVGQGAVSRAACEDYFGPGAPKCAAM